MMEAFVVFVAAATFFFVAGLLDEVVFSRLQK
jgi:hypothetical protein